ncbi:MAG: HEAT repeat domain-containing protein, partial [Treponema sp.]|nr:HEAT repeat domain-containing protein [Treponema sp.]
MMGKPGSGIRRAGLRALFLGAILLGSLCALPAAEEKNEAEDLENARLATIRYGTETEIAALIQSLRDEGADYLDGELTALVENTRNRNILRGVFAFFGERNKGGLEDRAIRAIEEWDEETNDTILAAVDYLGKVKAEKAADALKGLIALGERRFMNASFLALGRVSGANKALADETAGYLVDYYRDREPPDEYRQNIISAVGETGSSVGVEFLSGIASNTEERMTLRLPALEGLSKIGDRGGLEAIISAVSDGDPNVRSGAVAALGPFEGSGVDKAILEAFRDSYYRTRIGAAQAARKRKLEDAIPYLEVRIERDDVAAVKDESIRALGAIGGNKALGILERFFSERKYSDRIRVLAGNMLMDNDADKYADQLILELGKAKAANQTALYNGLLKVLGESNTGKLEPVARRFLESGGFTEKSYAL